MSVRQLKSGKWLADVNFGITWSGDRDRRTKACDSEKEAIKAEKKLLLERERLRGMSGRISLEDFLEHVYWPQKQGLRANTRRGYERDINLRLLPSFGHLDLADIDRFGIQRMLSKCSTRKVATNARETLSSILSVAVEMEMIPRNPASYRYSYPPAPPAEKDKDGVWLPTFAEHRELLEYVALHYPGEPIERILVLGLCFGLRKGEILGMDWERIDLEGAELEVMQTFVIAKGGPFMAPPKTPKSERHLPIVAYALERMKTWERASTTSPDLFDRPSHPVVVGRNRKRLSPATAENIVRRVRGLSFENGELLPAITTMSCRHSFATACIRAGIEVSTVAAWLGHRDVSTTYNRYVKPTLGVLREDAKAIDEAFSGA